MKKIVKIFRDRNPYGKGLVWIVKWSDGTEEYTFDSASGENRFRLLDELRMRQDYLDDKLKVRYGRIENQRGYVHTL